MSSGTVLVVDDDPVIVELLRVNFELEGWTVQSALDGEGGMAIANEERPDVIVLDVMMPGTDGLTVARRLRSGSSTSDIPIILLSAKAQAVDVQAGLEVAEEYVTKPFDPFDLLAVVSRVAGSDVPRS